MFLDVLVGLADSDNLVIESLIVSSNTHTYILTNTFPCFFSFFLSVPPRPPLELRELVKIHGKSSKENEEPLSHDEVLIVKVTHPPSHPPLVHTLSSLHPCLSSHTHTLTHHCRVPWRCGTRRWGMP